MPTKTKSRRSAPQRSAASPLADAQAEVATAKTALAAASTIAGRTNVMAPFDGVVAARLHNPGDMVDASMSDPVLRFVDPMRLQVSAAVQGTTGAPERVAGQPAIDPDFGVSWLQPGSRFGVFQIELRGARRGAFFLTEG